MSNKVDIRIHPNSQNDAVPNCFTNLFYFNINTQKEQIDYFSRIKE